jgi:hypothetical protein
MFESAGSHGCGFSGAGTGLTGVFGALAWERRLDEGEPERALAVVLAGTSQPVVLGQIAEPAQFESGDSTLTLTKLGEE